MKWLLLSLYTLYLAIYHVHACPTYWTYNGGSCYRYIGLPQTYARAESVCKMFTGCSGGKAGPGLGHLVSINSIEENQFVFSLLASNFGEIPPPAAWLGLSDNNQQQEFMWSDGTRVNSATFSAWAPNAPNQNNNVNCVIYGELIRPRWIDVACEEEFPYICEVSASKMETCPGANNPTNPGPPPLVDAPNRPKVIRYSASSNAQYP